MFKNKLPLILLGIFVILFVFFALAYADTLYLKNGRNIEGLIKSEDGEFVDLEIYFGAVKFRRDEIARIEKSSPQEVLAIRQKWERQKEQVQSQLLQRQLEEEKKPKKVQFIEESQSIVVGVTLNKKIEASLVLDTGASLVMLRRNIAEKLKIDLDKIKPEGALILADGRQVKAKQIILESIKVEGVEAKDVEAAVILDEAGDLKIGDGLLGMSFLKRFNFKVDHKEKRLILEKL